jgi:hypothetical protein
MEAAVKECIRDGLDHERRLREMPAKRTIVRLTEDERTVDLSSGGFSYRTSLGKSGFF